jgi:putative membrane protein
MGIMVPKEMNKADRAEYDKLQALSGADFDTAFLTLMVKGHHRAMREFRMEANTVTDPALRDAVGEGEHVIHRHLETANKLAREKGVPMPEHHAKPSPTPAPPSA